MHLKGLQTVALPKHPNTRVMAIDIDRRSNAGIPTRSIVDRLVNDLGNPFFIEHSIESGGYHLYWYYNEYVREDFWQTYARTLKREHMMIEPVIGKKALRLPYSSAYRCAGTYNDSNRSRVSSVGSIQEVLTLFREKTEISITSYMRRIIRDLPLIGDIAKIDRETDPSLSQRSPDDLVNDLGYGFGTRHIAQPKIAFYTLRRFGDDFNEFVNLCSFFNDGSSKDMSRSQDFVHRMLTNMWDWAVSHFTGDLSVKKGADDNVKPSSVIVNRNFRLSSYEKNSVRYIINHVYTNMYFGEKLHGKVHKRTVDDALKLFEIMYNKQRYHEETNARYSDPVLDAFNGSINFDEALRDAVAKEYGLKNPRKLLQVLLAAGLITLQRTEEGYAWSYKLLRYCKHYKVTTKIAVYIKTYLHKLHTYTSNSYYSNTHYGGHRKHKLYQQVLLDLGGEHLIDRLRRLQKLRESGRFRHKYGPNLCQT